jgi:hypothetical protein
MIERNISRSERAEADLDAFISKRHEQKVKMEGERLEEAVWVETSRREEARRREEMDRDRLDWHRHLVGVHAERMKYHFGIVNALEGGEKTDEGRKAS